MYFVTSNRIIFCTSSAIRVLKIVQSSKTQTFLQIKKNRTDGNFRIDKGHVRGKVALYKIQLRTNVLQHKKIWLIY